MKPLDKCKVWAYSLTFQSSLDKCNSSLITPHSSILFQFSVDKCTPSLSARGWEVQGVQRVWNLESGIWTPSTSWKLALPNPLHLPSRLLVWGSGSFGKSRDQLRRSGSPCLPWNWHWHWHWSNLSQLKKESSFRFGPFVNVEGIQAARETM